MEEAFIILEFSDVWKIAVMVEGCDGILWKKQAICFKYFDVIETFQYHQFLTDDFISFCALLKYSTIGKGL